MKLRTAAAVAAVGVALGGGAHASQYVFYDLEHDPRGVVGRNGMSSLLADIHAEWTSWAGHQVTLAPLLGEGDATLDADGERAVVPIESGGKVGQSAVASRNLTWPGDMGVLPGGDSPPWFDGRVERLAHDAFNHKHAGLTLASLPRASQLILIGVALLVVGALARRLARLPTGGEIRGHRAPSSGAGRDALPTNDRGPVTSPDVRDSVPDNGPVYEVGRVVSPVSGEEPGMPSPTLPKVRYTHVEH